VNGVITEAVIVQIIVQVIVKNAVGRIENGQSSIFRSNPQISLIIFCERVYYVSGKTIIVVYFMLKRAKYSPASVEQVQSATICADP
jgi:hypothetical protein